MAIVFTVAALLQERAPVDRWLWLGAGKPPSYTTNGAYNTPHQVQLAGPCILPRMELSKYEGQPFCVGMWPHKDGMHGTLPHVDAHILQNDTQDMHLRAIHHCHSSATTKATALPSFHSWFFDKCGRIHQTKRLCSLCCY
jgi:hypothetical protein